MLRSHLGAGKWPALWAACARCAALVFAGALRRVQEVQAQMDLPPQ